MTRIASERGTDAQALALQAIERMVEYDDWFAREVEKGLAQIERGETLSHEEVRARLETLLTKDRCRSFAARGDDGRTPQAGSPPLMDREPG